jgi:hypothetical protein
MLDHGSPPTDAPVKDKEPTKQEPAPPAAEKH